MKFTSLDMMRFEFKFLYLWRVYSLTPQNLFVMGLFKQYGEVFKDVRTYPLRGKLFFGTLFTIMFLVELIVTILKYYIKFQILFPFSSIMLGVIILCDASGSGNTNYIAFAGIFGIVSFIGAGINISRNCDECCRHGKGFLQ